MYHTQMQISNSNDEDYEVTVDVYTENLDMEEIRTEAMKTLKGVFNQSVIIEKLLSPEWEDLEEDMLLEIYHMFKGKPVRVKGIISNQQQGR